MTTESISSDHPLAARRRALFDRIIAMGEQGLASVELHAMLVSLAEQNLDAPIVFGYPEPSDAMIGAAMLEQPDRIYKLLDHGAMPVIPAHGSPALADHMQEIMAAHAAKNEGWEAKHEASWMDWHRSRKAPVLTLPIEDPDLRRAIAEGETLTVGAGGIKVHDTVTIPEGATVMPLPDREVPTSVVSRLAIGRGNFARVELSAEAAA